MILPLEARPLLEALSPVFTAPTFTRFVTLFGSAILCLLGAGAFAASSAIITGDLDLADVQGRLQGVAQPSSPPPPAYVPPPPRPAASRVR